MYYLIYQTTNKVNGKIYVGKHITKDLNDGYLGSGKYFRNAIKKYGIENFERKILFFCENSDELKAKEKEIVNEDFVAREDTYNLKVGGDGGWDYINNELHFNGIKSYHKNKSEQEIKEIYKKAGEGSQKHFANLTEEEHKKLSEKQLKYFETHPGTWCGKHHTDESKEKISKSHKGKYCGKENSAYGRHWWKDPNDKTKFRFIKEGDPIPEGWVRGRWSTEKEIANQISKNKGKHFKAITNGVNTKFIEYDGISTSSIVLPIGWRFGSTSKGAMNFHWITNGKERKFVDKTLEIPDGWHKGMK